MRREVELLPDWLTEGLVKDAKQEERKKEAGPPSQVWQRVEIGGTSYIVRSARKLRMER